MGAINGRLMVNGKINGAQLCLLLFLKGNHDNVEYHIQNKQMSSKVNEDLLHPLGHLK